MDNLCPHIGDDHQVQITDRVGWYRAVVVETNDPLNLRRIRIKIPEFHDFDIKPEDTQWAIPAPTCGGKRNGKFDNVCIGDQVWISFEKGSIYNPIWHGIATPTRRALYPIPSVYTETPDMVRHDGTIKGVNDYDKDYLPKDGRPMSSGWTDRYGNFDISSAVGFFPIEHKEKPADPGQDTIKEKPFITREQAKQNDPDIKYLARGTKYGSFQITADQGYQWNAEFKGDSVEDEEFEIKRWKYYQKLFCENKPKDKDQRRYEIRTRAGHKAELRDVGWNKTRQDEFGDQVTISDSKLDERWIKLRTKGGILWQMSDVGSDPINDEFYKRNLLDECGTATEKEDEYFKDKDFRMFRVVTRHGIKIALDDRGTHKTSADVEETPRGNGLLIKGRRSPGRDVTGNPIGFYFEFNENEDAQRLTIGSPLGAVFQISDDLEYTMLCQAVPKYPRPWQGIKENEFLLKPVVMESPEAESHHFKIDHQNEYIRFKTRSGKGAGPFTKVVKSDTSLQYQQGIECRDGTNGDGAWTEIVDGKNRGMWFSTRYRLGIWRSEISKKMYVWMDENKDEICIVNTQPVGKIRLYSNSNVDVISGGTVSIQAGKDIILKAGNQIKMNKKFVISDTDAITPPSVPDKVFPADRGETYNKPKEMDIKEVEHPNDAPAAAKDIPSKDTSRAIWDRIAGNDT